MPVAMSAAEWRAPSKEVDMQSLKDRHVVVTGGTGALGSAVVKAFIEAGAICHIPAIEATPPTGHLPESKQIEIVPSVDLSNEAYKFGVNYVVYALTH